MSLPLCLGIIYKGFDRQRRRGGEERLEPRGRLENEGTKRTTTQDLDIIQKVPETVKP